VTRTLYDALDPDNVPAGARCVAYYTDVLTPAQARARWPEALLVSIDRVPEQADGLVDDCEAGALTVSQLPGRAAAKRAAGISDPWAYCSEAPWPAVRLAFAAAPVPPPLYWVAAPGALAEGLLAGTVATQRVYTGTYDQSALADYVPGLDPPPPPKEDPDVLHVTATVDAAGTQSEFLFSGQALDHIPDSPTDASIGGAIPCVTWSLAFYQQILARLATAPAAGAPTPEPPMTLELTGTATPAPATT
jgi:hypothetical protein